MTGLRRLRGRASEGGFTLIELMMAITILGIIMAPIGAGFFVALRTIDETANRRKGSNDAQLLSLYLPPDVQSANDAFTVASPPSGGFTSSTCTGVTASNIKAQIVASSNDSDYLDASDLNVVYYTQQVSAGSAVSYQLVRKTCVGTVSTHVVARNLASLTAVTAARSPTATSSALVRVSMTVTEATTPTDTTPYTFTVTASKRTS